MDLSKKSRTVPDKEDSKTLPKSEKVNNKITFQCHYVGCRNENKSFKSLRQIYPHKQISGLWEFFVNCNGDIDWVDALLKEDEESSFGVDLRQYKRSAANRKANVLRCNCDTKENEILDSSYSSAGRTLGGIKKKRERMRVLNLDDIKYSMDSRKEQKVCKELPWMENEREIEEQPPQQWTSCDSFASILKKAPSKIRECEPKITRAKNSTSHSWDGIDSGKRILKASSVQPDEARNNIQEIRTLVSRHRELMAEFNQKTSEANQKRQGCVGLHYSQTANLQKRKLEMLFQRAAMSIMDAHKQTQNKDLLDLHNLSVLEAETCLEIFLDRKITELRNTSQVYKNVFIITGRGLHSKSGISEIKINVKYRLKERNLSCKEDNPGLLKVKIWTTSKKSEDI